MPSGQERRSPMHLAPLRRAALWLSALLMLQTLGRGSADAQHAPAESRAACGELCFLDNEHRPLPAATATLQVSRFITNGPTLPSADSYAESSRATGDFKLQVEDATQGKPRFAILESRNASGVLRATLKVPLGRPSPELPLRSPYVRLVADEVDHHARGAEARTLRVALRDQVIARYELAGRTVERSLRVAPAGDRDDPLAARLVRLNVHVLRVAHEGSAVIGHDDSSALAVMRAQLAAANEIWLQCNVSFGAPTETAIEVVAPPPASLLAVANEDGLPARGGGELRFRVDGHRVGPIATQAGAAPVATARTLADAISQLGFVAVVSENLPTRASAGPSADVIVRKRDGSLATISTDGNSPLSTDRRQSLQLGRVDLGDGLQEFDNTTAQVGSLEERTLVKTLADDDPRSIDIFVVNHFTKATRQGEAFIADPAGPITNTVIIDRNGLRHAPLAWTLAHELGHVLMNDPLHPDNVGPDRPWLLMDADSGRGTVDGPKRLRQQDCQRMQTMAKRARHPLLTPFDSESNAAPQTSVPSVLQR